MSRYSRDFDQPLFDCFIGRIYQRNYRTMMQLDQTLASHGLSDMWVGKDHDKMSRLALRLLIAKLVY